MQKGGDDDDNNNLLFTWMLPNSYKPVNRQALQRHTKFTKWKSANYIVAYKANTVDQKYNKLQLYSTNITFCNMFHIPCIN